MRQKTGFTLIEILVVATIISLLAGLSIVSYSQFIKKSRDERRKADLDSIRAALEMYRSDNDTYPSSLTDLLTPSPQKYLEKIPTDPKYNYTYPYVPSPSGCNGSTSICTDYTLYGYLETVSSCSTSQTCGSNTCNYCVGPYGEK